MHFNFHFLKFLCPALEDRFQGTEISSCFSQNKNELIIACTRDEEDFYIRANLLPTISCMGFPNDFKRGKRNTASLFADLIGQVIASVRVVDFERAFLIGFESGDRLLFKLHGSRSNVLFYKIGEDLPSILFRNDLKMDREISLAAFPKSFDLGFPRFESLEGNALQFLPTLGKIPREWLQSHGYIDADLEVKWALMQELLDMLESPLFTIAKRGKEHVLSLLPEENPIFQTDDPIKACNALFGYLVVVQAFDKEKSHWQKIFEDQRKKSIGYIHKTSQKLEELTNEISPGQIADVIMANLHQIDPNQEEVRLFNFYTEKEETIKLKRGQSPQKFAENLYRKSKNRKIETLQLRENLEGKQSLVEKLGLMLTEISQIKEFRGLREFIKKHNLVAQEKESQEQVPFKRFDVEGFEVLVGKSAKGNDEMLRNYAWKEDLWLHAKDVSGSHVLVKFKSGIKFPKSVIERAAELAAYYSKNKNESLAAVIYTPSKYVRKVKGSAPGAVMVDKENILLIPPKGPS